MASEKLSKVQLQWQQMRSGLWERDIDEYELFYKSLIKTGRSPLTVTSTASFVVSKATTKSQQSVETALRKAWLVLRYKHPSLSTVLEYNEETKQWKRVYTSILDGEAHERWQQSMFWIIDTELQALEWLNHEAPDVHTTSIFLINSSADAKIKRAIVLRCPRDISDHISVLRLLNELFEHASQAHERGSEYILPEFGNEYTRLAPCPRTAAGVPEPLPREYVHRYEAIRAQNSVLLNNSILGLPSNSRAVAPSPDKMFGLTPTASKALSDKIPDRIKAFGHGFDMTHLFTAALANALAEVQPKRDVPYLTSYVSHSTINPAYLPASAI